MKKIKIVQDVKDGKIVVLTDTEVKKISGERGITAILAIQRKSHAYDTSDMSETELEKLMEDERVIEVIGF